MVDLGCPNLGPQSPSFALGPKSRWCFVSQHIPWDPPTSKDLNLRSTLVQPSLVMWGLHSTKRNWNGSGVWAKAWGVVYEPFIWGIDMKKNIPNSNLINRFGYLDRGFSRKRRMDWAVFGVAPAAFHERTFHILGVAGVDSLSIVHPTGTPPNLGMGLIEILGHRYYPSTIPGSQE